MLVANYYNHSLDFVQDNPGKPVPEGRFHLLVAKNRLNFDA